MLEEYLMKLIRYDDINVKIFSGCRNCIVKLYENIKESKLASAGVESILFWRREPPLWMKVKTQDKSLAFSNEMKGDLKTLLREIKTL